MNIEINRNLEFSMRLVLCLLVYGLLGCGPGRVEKVRLEDGRDGIDGVQGQRGHKGPQGEVGIAGDAGPQGVEGPQGSQGGMGIQGPVGPSGPQGPMGPQGQVGEVDFRTILICVCTRDDPKETNMRWEEREVNVEEFVFDYLASKTKYYRGACE